MKGHAAFARLSFKIRHFGVDGDTGEIASVTHGAATRHTQLVRPAQGKSLMVS
jgi:hypothetical protein